MTSPQSRSSVDRNLPKPRPLLVVVAMIVAIGALATAAGATPQDDRSARGAVAIQGQTRLTYPGHGDRDGEGRAEFTIAGDASRVLFPGSSSLVDLTFTNPTDQSINLPAGAIKITISSPRVTCRAYPNFSVVQTLAAAINIPKHATDESLGDLHVPSRYWPVISMVTTHVTQDACAGMTLTLHYSAGAPCPPKERTPWVGRAGLQ